MREINWTLLLNAGAEVLFGTGGARGGGGGTAPGGRGIAPGRGGGGGGMPLSTVVELEPDLDFFSCSSILARSAKSKSYSFLGSSFLKILSHSFLNILKL